MDKKQQMKDWAEKNRKFIKISDGETLTAKLIDFKPLTSRFDSDKNVMRYSFEMADGSIKFWENGSPRVCEELAEYVDDIVSIFRDGDGPDTKYIIGEGARNDS